MITTFQEHSFSPSEAHTCTGLSAAMQRNWRQHGYLPKGDSLQNRYTPSELVMIRIMRALRHLGLDLTRSQEIAIKAAPSVLYHVLHNHPESWSIKGIDAAAEARMRTHVAGDDTLLRDMAGLSGEPYTWAIGRDDGGVDLITAIANKNFKADAEVETVVKLVAVARHIAAALPRPLMSAVMRKSA